MNHLFIRDLTKSFGKNYILNEVTLQCGVGEIVGVFGRNGTGKSTMLRCVFGTMRSNAIYINIDDETIKPKEVIADGRIGYLPQDSFLPKEKKVRDIIPLLFPNGEDQDKIFYTKGIHSIENRRAGKLSLGELRYLEVVLLSHLEHQFLMMDEPFSMIQPSYKELIKELLLSIKKKKGIIITDHYYEDVLDITDRNFLIKEGSLIAIQNKTDLVTHGYLRSR
ncbi:ATP-binding cassette domain-containing protein [Aquimarina sp. BL5]|uniref:ATP-binding cassette domain-containing protein n=1 Tax=Aquimarina sp. BL5 TaxID=1714860 RepID=UPI000E52B6F5|nr:ATP-binding cassette domain-containing protein [Aquimarina sp. BL5]AXT52204.1 ATP-binding cassette domain-containing protein [Aquimarina sp. BL5]RKN07685.1 ATP-binding cassette domain-containing protein [Aquimarina sp. BL5]